MTQEDKDLLLKELSARLPYGIKVQYTAGDGITTIDNCNVDQVSIKSECITISDTDSNFVWRSIDSCKPYLRSMDNMTKEEKEELRQEHIKDEKLFAECLTKAANGDSSMRGKVIPHFAADWCNKNHFDYRGLIEKGLALEAPEGMYNLEKK